MAHNEWELLVAAEDIEPGDTLTIEEEGGDQSKAQFVKEKGRGTIELKGKEGAVRLFSVHNLEELEGYAFITGKVHD